MAAATLKDRRHAFASALQRKRDRILTNTILQNCAPSYASDCRSPLITGVGGTNPLFPQGVKTRGEMEGIVQFTRIYPTILCLNQVFLSCPPTPTGLPIIHGGLCGGGGQAPSQRCEDLEPAEGVVQALEQASDVLLWGLWSSSRPCKPFENAPLPAVRTPDPLQDEGEETHQVPGEIKSCLFKDQAT
eukprot:jgi/Bigna1/71298/fgenesh1_pg.15_\